MAKRRRFYRLALVVLVQIAAGLFVGVWDVAGAQGTQVPDARLIGRGKVCLSDEVKLPRGQRVDLPATTVFEDAGLISGKNTFPKKWKIIAPSEMFPPRILLIAPVVLTSESRCADARFELYLEREGSRTKLSGSESRVFRIDDVIDYPIPDQKPFIEIADLIGDMQVHAVLLSDVTGGRKADSFHPSEEEAAQECLRAATKLAAHLGVGLGRQTSSIVALGGIPGAEASYSCPRHNARDVDVNVSWSGNARPAPSVRNFIIAAGEFLTGASRREMTEELDKCITEALKPVSREVSRRDFRGAAIECQAFRRDGGGGNAMVYRRYGALPIRPEPSVEQLAALGAASKAVKAADDAAAEQAAAFVKWWEDPAVPKDVKVFIMTTARVLTLVLRCPSVAPDQVRISLAAKKVGISLDDIAEGGKYNRLMMDMMAVMGRMAAEESVPQACEAARKYGGK